MDHENVTVFVVATALEPFVPPAPPTGCVAVR
jgi:hypothetical protein